MTQLICCAPDKAHHFWHVVEGMIDRGYAPGDDIMPKDLLERIEANHVQLWLAVKDGLILAAMTTELVPMRSGLACWMCQCGGEHLPDWVHLHKEIEEFAKREGCVKVILRGRAGWMRLLDGYRVRTVQLEKAL